MAHQHLARPGVSLRQLARWVAVRRDRMGLAVHRETRTNRHIRAVYDFLATALPNVL